MNTWNAGQIITVVRTINRMDISYLGSDETAQNQTLFQFMNVSLWKLARLCYNTETSDTISITTNGPVTFTNGNTVITNMFEPLRLLQVVSGTETEVPRRNSDTAPLGWYRESPNQSIDARGLNGSYKLKYIRYPRQVTQNSDPVDCPESGYQTLINEISAMVKSVKNYYEESSAMAANAKSGYTGLVQAAISGRGPSTGGQPPSMQDATVAKGG